MGPDWRNGWVFLLSPALCSSLQHCSELEAWQLVRWQWLCVMAAEEDSLFLERLICLLLPPFLPILAALLLLKSSRKLEDIGTAQLFEGAVSAIIIVDLWGALGRERSRGLIIGTSTFLLLVYCSGLIWVLCQPDLNSVIPGEHYFALEFATDVTKNSQWKSIWCIWRVY